MGLFASNRSGPHLFIFMNQKLYSVYKILKFKSNHYSNKRLKFFDIKKKKKK